MENEEKIFIGVDPGKKGAIAVINSKRDVILLDDYPGNVMACVKILDKIAKMGFKSDRTYAAIEKVHAMPKQGVTSMFSFGENFGAWQGIIAMSKYSLDLPRPQQWSKGVVSKKNNSKSPSVDAAARMFPTTCLYGPRGGAKDGRAEALLIADWLRRQYIS
jgi:hypothetical protein